MTDCEMAGCTNTAEFWIIWKYELGVYEICEDCADYWRQDQEYPAKIKPFANKTVKPFWTEGYWQNA